MEFFFKFARWPNVATAKVLAIFVYLMYLFTIGTSSQPAAAQVVAWTQTFASQERGSSMPECDASERTRRNIARDSAGNIYVAGRVFGTQFHGVVVTKFDGTSGSPIWTQNYVGRLYGRDCASSITIDADGNVAIAGFTSNDPTAFGSSMMAAKLSGATGAVIWWQSYATSGTTNTFGNAIATDAAGNVFVAGTIENAANGNRSFVVARFDGATGERRWQVTPGSQYLIAKGEAVAIDAAGDVYVTGEGRNSETASSGGITAKLSGATGTEIWARDYVNSEGPTIGRAIRLTTAGELVVTGIGFNAPFSERMATAKHNAASGDLVWAKQFSVSGSSKGGGRDVTTDSSGNVFVTGYVQDPSVSSTSGGEQYVVKYSASGAPLWFSAAPAQDSRRGTGTSITTDASGGVLVTGAVVGSRIANAFGPVDPQDWATTKLDGTTGAVLWSNTVIRTDSIQQVNYGTGVVVDAIGNAYAVGRTSAGSDGFSDIRVYKYSASTGTEMWRAASEVMNTDSVATLVEKDAADNLIVVGQVGMTRQLRVAKYDGVTGAEKWANQIGNASTNAMALDKAGNVYAGGGYIRPAPSFSIYNASAGYIPVAGSLNTGSRIYKFDAQTGSVVWESILNANRSAFVERMLADSTGDVYVRGRYTTVPQTPFTAKFSGANGALLWQLEHPNAASGAVLPQTYIASDGNLILATQVDVPTQSPQYNSVQFTKLDKSTGNALWSTTYQNLFGLVSTLSGIFPDGNQKVLAIIFAAYDPIAPYRLISLDDATGSFQTDTTYLALPNVETKASLRDGNGDIVLALTNGAIHKIDPLSGRTLWQTQFPSGPIDAMSIMRTGNVATVGRAYSAVPGQEIRMSVLDNANGQIRWSHAYVGAPAWPYERYNIIGSGNGAVVIGSTQALLKKPGWFVQKIAQQNTSGGSCPVR